MTKVLSSAKLITQHHDHQLVDGALTYSLMEVLGHKRCRFALRLYRVTPMNGKLYIVLTTQSDGRAVLNDEVECDPAKLPRRMIEALEYDAVTAEAIDDKASGTIHYSWLPVSHENDLLGCIELGTKKPLTLRQVTLIDGMRCLYGNHLSLLNYSQIDTLTRLLNRKTFDDSLRKMLSAARVKLSNAPMADRRGAADETSQFLAIMDIDHFKRINDTHGHLYGDEVLAQLADIMRQRFRVKDRLFRVGGEEFVVLLRDTSERNAMIVFERFRKAVEEFKFDRVGQVTLSIGFTEVHEDDLPTTLLGRADEALYFAKHHGRNQVARFSAAAKVATSGSSPTVH